jgi:hypothetical protein
MTIVTQWTMLGLSLGALSFVGGPASPAQPMEHLRFHGPIEDRVDQEDHTSTSSNWGGYAIEGTSFTSVHGSWVVPAAKCTSGNSASGFWIGIDGFKSKTVEQTGTASECSGATPKYYAWVEFYPKPPKTVDVEVTPGDVMSASVVYEGSEFKCTIRNVTTGKSATESSAVAGAERSSAEWIAEAPGTPLTDFGTGDFGEDHTKVDDTGSATDGATSGVIGKFPGSSTYKIIMGSKGTKEAVPSDLSTDGTSFTVTWEHD